MTFTTMLRLYNIELNILRVNRTRSWHDYTQFGITRFSEYIFITFFRQLSIYRYSFSFASVCRPKIGNDNKFRFFRFFFFFLVIFRAKKINLYIFVTETDCFVTNLTKIKWIHCVGEAGADISLNFPELERYV